MFSTEAIFKPTILLALALMAVIAMMILPIPAWVLDLGLATSFALAILMFTVTLFIQRPLDFSIFPTVLLASLMLRLSLNVSSTKLIIGEGHTGTHAAGGVIQGFASFVMSGSVFLGVVIFLVLLIVNFIVITKGAGRMAEVGARFALDGMPGKQLAIDSDMSAGAIDHTEARRRRETEQAETNFYGSLDGASKFVKGDAIAGLLITLLNIVMGLINGTMMHGMSIGAAFETYAILTVGDGLVSQIPAVIISIAAALLLARGGANGATDTQLFEQLGRYPSAIATVGFLMAMFAFIPGLPFIPFVIGAGVLIGLAWLAQNRINEAEIAAATPPETLPEPPKRGLGDILDLDEIHVQFAPDLVPMVLDPALGLDGRISNIRNHVAREFGLILPEIRLTDDPSLPEGTYAILIHGVEQARDLLRPNKMLALVQDDATFQITGEAVKEPVYQAPARWIDPAQQENATLSGTTVVSPVEVLATHLLEVLKSNFARLLTFKSLHRILDEFTSVSDAARADANKRLLNDMIPDKVPVDLLLGVLRLLLDERVSIRNLPLILEAMSEVRSLLQGSEAVCEHVRQRLGFQLVAPLKRADGTLPLIQLAPDWEEIFSTYQISGEYGAGDVALPPEDFTRLTEQVARKLGDLGQSGISPALVTSARRRRFLRTALSAKGLSASVLSYEEIGLDARPALVGTIPA
ncbi:flagellar biosynthesis protein FlhA [Roseinatronobacter bogoriensis]|uniref:Flagellar biosynthesis protein FlhA n=1 Tax=Roseinatronobacter bogoriensis subsp. barguzinensis TaxID=441209 RepID=A0A2K8KE44_9RHOB|nr:MULTISPECIES: flagellar biosynthesis protein FlhA [Rhodobaca]ATX66015.1 flagellar biosynthesis protein FlhA [Rhodobaca barguzinensis]MBB4207987.1 flagellar biosynthesis protein FlhA [Rhodobaca bogoriensis DSM 18756]TDW38626.1 flagellar biosynthesis protein FlhA [Rhodobaca barguzinensis]TDY69335.1 flagellar biosynthesis protein FlhA [Rhodobaca bogoriensis DSM 18756]